MIIFKNEKSCFIRVDNICFEKAFESNFEGSAQHGAQWSADIGILLRGSVRVRWRHYSPPPKGGGENISRDLGLGQT